jgi:hypothetical protein
MPPKKKAEGALPPDPTKNPDASKTDLSIAESKTDIAGKDKDKPDEKKGKDKSAAKKEKDKPDEKKDKDKPDDKKEKEKDKGPPPAEGPGAPPPPPTGGVVTVNPGMATENALRTGELPAYDAAKHGMLLEEAEVLPYESVFEWDCQDPLGYYAEHEKHDKLMEQVMKIMIQIIAKSFN